MAIFAKEAAEIAAKKAAEEAAKAAAKAAAVAAAKAAAITAAEEAANTAAKNAAQETAAKAAREAANTAAGKVTQDMTKTGAKATDINGAPIGFVDKMNKTIADVIKIPFKGKVDNVAEKAIKNVDIGEVTTDAAKGLEKSTNPRLLSKMKKLMVNNPGKTLGGALGVGLGAYGLANSLESYLKSNNQTVNITCSFETNVDPSTYYNCPNSSVSSYPEGDDTGDIVVRFGPSVKIVDGDTIIFSNTTFEPNFDGQEIDVKTIVSPSCIIINMPNTQKYASTGTFIIHTTMANRMLDTATDAVETVAEKTVSVATSAGGSLFNTIDSALGGLLTKIKNVFGNGLIYCYIFCGILCIMVIIYIILKFIK